MLRLMQTAVGVELDPAPDVPGCLVLCFESVTMYALLLEDADDARH
jgi:hypothetical protein